LDGSVIPGDTVFRLYDTYGFPVDLTADVAREHDLTVDMEGFEQAMSVQKEQARAASQFNAVDKLSIDVDRGTEFTGHDELSGQAEVLALYQGGEAVDELAAGDEGLLILDRSPFYAEGGGQVGDRGALRGADGDARFDVVDTQRQGEHHLHKGRMSGGRLRTGDTVSAEVERDNRHAVMLNHSATHLLHAALRDVLGEHVTQKGSLVSADRLRFDFSHNAPLTEAQARRIETMVNDQILANHAVSKERMSMDQAMDRGALALFGEKYGEEVRVVTMGEFSVELCGGTHVQRTGDIGLFKLIGESGVAAGVRRVEAVTGHGALEYVRREEQTLREVCQVLKSGADNVVERARQIMDSSRRLERELDQARMKLASAAGTDITADAVEVGGVKLLTRQVEGFNSKTLRDTVDQLKNKLGSGVIVLANVEDGKVSLVAGVTRDLTDRIKAGDLVNAVAARVGGKGGGRPDMAMAGGQDVAAVPGALESVSEWLESRL
ncbi:MAG: alanine--tRNA ligase, partial [Pseudomonadota bacterium]